MASNDGLEALSREELLALIDDMRADWKQANRIMNTQATAFGWCFEYEDRVEKYNHQFKVLKMVGRTEKGQRLSVRNAFAARRMVMGHVMSTFEQLGIEMPEIAWGGVVRDHKALDAAHEQLLEQFKSEATQRRTEDTSQHPAENPQAFLPSGTPPPPGI